MELPEALSEPEFDALRRQREFAEGVLRRVFAEVGECAGSLEVYPDGSTIVGRCGDLVAKVFAPFDGELARAEGRVLAHIAGRLDCPPPRRIAEGALDGWPYVVMTALAGEPLSVVWNSLDPSARVKICEAIGETAAQLHALPVEGIADLPPAWPTFLETQRATSVERQRAHALEERWLEQIDPFLAEVTLPPAPLALLHTELMRDHFLVERRGGGWQLSGLFDFEPALVGHPEYEFSSVGLFVTDGAPGLLGPLLRAYGLAEHELDEERQLRSLAYTLLHRYSCLPWYLRELDHEGVQSLRDLARRWWCY